MSTKGEKSPYAQRSPRDLSRPGPALIQGRWFLTHGPNVAMGGSPRPQDSTSTITFLCTQADTQLAVPKAEKYICYQVVTRYAGGVPERYVAHVMRSAFRTNYVRSKVDTHWITLYCVVNEKEQTKAVKEFRCRV